MLSKILITTAVVLMSTFHGSGVQADNVPTCLPGCMDKTANPCSSNSLPGLITCLNNNCPSSAQEAAAAAIHVTYTPKLQYSCQQSLVPGSDGPPSDPLALHGNGSCVTSPFPFKSFVATGATPAVAGNACNLLVYDDAECQGTESKVDLLAGEAEGCQFKGGKSAKLVCQGAQVMTQVASTQLFGMCSSNSTNTTSSVASETSVYGASATSSNATSATSAPASITSTASTANITTSTTSATASRKPTSSPVTGLACMSRGVDSNLATIAIVVAGLLML